MNMNNKCYGFITITIISTFAIYYKLNKKIKDINRLILSLEEKLDDIAGLNISCEKIGEYLHNETT